jgi:hypothetical protein
MKFDFPARVLLGSILSLVLVGCGGSDGPKASHPDPVPVQVDYTPKTPRLASEPLYADLKTLSDPAMEGRKIGTAGNVKAREFLVRRFAELGLAPVGASYTQPFTYRGTAGVNLVGSLSGTRHSEQVILVSGHYDHVGIRGGSVYAGADDNASGSAALLQLAGWLKSHPPAHTVLFCLFDGEEAGLYGSQAFVAAPPIPLLNIAVVINLDMIAQGTQGRIFVGGTSYTAGLKLHLQAAYGDSTIRVVPDFETYDAYSDQYPFMQKGVPFLFFCVGDDDPWYHTPLDTYDRIPKAFYWASTEAILDTLIRLDLLDTLPSLLPHAAEMPTAPGQRALPPHPWRKDQLSPQSPQ